MSGGYGPRVPENATHGQGPFLIQVLGIPERYTWQDLKDLVRPEATHGVHTKVEHGGRGIVRVGRWNEAVNLFRYLANNIFENRRLYVEIWDISEKNPRCIWKNWSGNSTRQAPEASQSAQNGQWQAEVQRVHTTPTYTIAPVAATVPASQAALVQGMAALQMSQQQAQAYSQYAAQAVQAQQMAAYGAANHEPVRQGPLYAPSVTGIPTNIDRGYARTEYRGVFVSGLNFKVRTNDIKELFSRCGKVVKCDHHKDSDTGKSRGSAIITYGTPEEAQKAVSNLDGREWMNRTIKVRLDKEATTVAPPPQSTASTSTQTTKVNNSGPVIVDSSKSSQRR
ncbi:hypothetical protein LTR37_011644 [Vermiconidia calcicola]|uniref:Uncharacterized protein n=1 Tax=Vermiconidia calcicola TaxID=1690605 RepID=A0ACC3N1H6_9PEZI|nr:hypothetical protein LTR37_011644 [Vermiconidia calcicola]